MPRIRNWHKAENPPKVNPHGRVAHERGQGFVSTDGMFLCYCGSINKNTAKSISSHLTKAHKDDSAYQRGQFSEDGTSWECPICHGAQGKNAKNLHALVAHARRVHGLRGSSDDLCKEGDPFRPNLKSKFLDFKSEKEFEIAAIRLRMRQAVSRH
ncbi:uncharacterized protein F4822DRAFT_405734 [Hypoxylon trugodes]|uniref:uncharacterized protein n=1 Tax=Hypoxylon trugodes TaxID=326681 RepID=UPI00219DC8D4|nr:uncharacterized protein F4822DRAFT_405734 [Hypoxylon trugodes]KAI1387204.1 hypothetical protein F4822DRAFT_405734 [Hypoxylon trugodes]